MSSGHSRWLLEPLPDDHPGACDRWVLHGPGPEKEPAVLLSFVDEADARLMAAAPQLLRAAERVLAHASATNLDELRQAVKDAKRFEGLQNGFENNQTELAAAFRLELAQSGFVGLR